MSYKNYNSLKNIIYNSNTIHFQSVYNFACTHPSSTLADPNTRSPPDSPRDHNVSCANKYDRTIRTRAYKCDKQKI